MLDFRVVGVECVWLIIKPTRGYYWFFCLCNKNTMDTENKSVFILGSSRTILNLSKCFKVFNTDLSNKLPPPFVDSSLYQGSIFHISNKSRFSSFGRRRKY